MRRLVWLSLVLTLSLFATAGRAVTLGDDGLHKQDWFTITFRNVAEDIEEARAVGKRLALVFEQRGCVYCLKLHEVLLADDEIQTYVKEHFLVVQYNLFGDEEVTDLDGSTLTEKLAAEKWDVLFTPMFLFMPETAPETGDAGTAAVSRMPGAFGKQTFLNMFRWVYEKGYEGDEHFQTYHARMLRERQAAGQPVSE